MTREGKLWDSIAGEYVDPPAKVVAFLDEYEALCQKHGLCLSHEDRGGSFIIQKLDGRKIAWVREANLRGLSDS